MKERGKRGEQNFYSPRCHYLEGVGGYRTVEASRPMHADLKVRRACNTGGLVVGRKVVRSLHGGVSTCVGTNRCVQVCGSAAKLTAVRLQRQSHLGKDEVTI